MPLRLDKTDIDDDAMPAPDQFESETVDNLLGQDAFEVVAQTEFLVLSGATGVR